MEDSQVRIDGRLIDIADNAWREEKLSKNLIDVPPSELPDPEADNGDSHMTIKEQEQKWSDLALGRRGTSNNVDIKSFACSHVDCNQISPLEMLCPKCQKHFCLLHRYHNCFDVVEDIEEKKRLWNTPREQFAASVKAVDKMVNDNLKKAMQNPKKQATAAKIQLMKLKGKATGSPSVPTTDRIYFLVILPKSLNKGAKPVFVSKDWSIGKVIDSASTICNVPNRNNEMNSPKLKLFKVDGTQVSTEMNSKLVDIIEGNRIFSGETLILEYVNPSDDSVNYVLSNCCEYNSTI
ncbi:hypothetical protein RUM44_000916 [Polyplax serrata]|uniref:Anaphase-promoting complex subunit 13 n=1 Tax=Polyplax serrata TaxID=468196 RepID=A0ABR1B6D7_POLSC